MRQEDNPDELRGEAQEDRARIEYLKDQDLCLWCGTRPQNPALDHSFCVPCAGKHPLQRCDQSGCPNNAEMGFREGKYCRAHGFNEVHRLDEKVGDMMAGVEQDAEDSQMEKLIETLIHEIRRACERYEGVFPENYEPNYKDY